MKMQIAQIQKDLIIVLVIMDTWEMDSIALVIYFLFFSLSTKAKFNFYKNYFQKLIDMGNKSCQTFFLRCQRMHNEHESMR